MRAKAKVTVDDHTDRLRDWGQGRTRPPTQWVCCNESEADVFTSELQTLACTEDFRHAARPACLAASGRKPSAETLQSSNPSARKVHRDQLPWGYAQASTIILSFYERGKASRTSSASSSASFATSSSSFSASVDWSTHSGQA